MATLFLTGPVTAIIAATVPGGQTLTLLDAATVVYRTAKKVLRFLKTATGHGENPNVMTPAAAEIARRRSRGGSMDDILLSPTS
jgi:hypothetical protein